MPGTGDAPAGTCAAYEQQGSVFLEDDSNPATEPRLRERSAQAGSAASLSGSRSDLREMHRRASRVRADAEDAQKGLPRIFSTFSSLAM